LETPESRLFEPANDFRSRPDRDVQRQWLSSESQSLVERLFSGRVAPLVAHFSRHRRLTKKDLLEIKRLIGELTDDQ
jgi:predicted transcriptional regulator